MDKEAHMYTKVRSVRIDNDTWERAKRTAEKGNTTVSALIVDSLRILADEALGIRQIETVLESHRKPKRPPVDPETCLHRSKKTLSFGTWCAACRKKLA